MKGSDGIDTQNNGNLKDGCKSLVGSDVIGHSFVTGLTIQEGKRKDDGAPFRGQDEPNETFERFEN